VNDQPKPKLELTPHQLCAILIIESQCAQLQLGANQLGGFLGLKREAEMLLNAIQVLQKDKERLIHDWSKQVQIVPASAIQAIPSLVKP
jgi:hypothetical protein